MADDAEHDVAATAAKVAEDVKAAAAEAATDVREAAADAKDSFAAKTSSCLKEWLPTKNGIKCGLTDFKNVFLFPLCTGLMTGIGFVAGKRVAERYFYGPNAKVAVQ